VEPDGQSPRIGKGAEASFCIPRAAIKALIDAKADVVTIGAYLTLACFTDSTGRYSSASIRAIRDYMSLHQERAKRALQRLMTITVKEGKGGKAKATALVYGRDAWIKETGEIPPDGPVKVKLAKILHVLPDFGEPLTERVWFGSNLVQGYGSFTKPLKRVKDAGDAAARLLLLMYQAVDMFTWGGVPPNGVPPNAGPWRRYNTVLDQTVSNSRIIHGQDSGPVMNMGLMATIAGTNAEAALKTSWDALDALVGIGLFYEVVLVLNRNPVTAKFKSGEEYGDVPPDAEPLYELDARSLHGYKPQGEGGLGGFTARTAGELGLSVAAGQPVTEDGYELETDHRPGQFMGKYAAIVQRGQGTMIVGIYRPRFRVANAKNAGVKDAWRRIYDGNRDGLAFIESLRMAKGLKPLHTAAASESPAASLESLAPKHVADPVPEPAKPRLTREEKAAMKAQALSGRLPGLPAGAIPEDDDTDLPF
jgi:hypothetical protein